ncbi:hypothetical protein CSB11_00255 [Candidatus Campbellbacteria bacterium]|nr:MAG: hypothetical protein CSB11_00255 [Candidatus Campbellbacteria bacterium]
MEQEQRTNHNITDIEISEKRREFTNLQNNKRTFKQKNKRIWYKFLAFFVLALAFFVFISYFLHSATVEIKPKTENLVFSNDIYTATISDGQNIDGQKGNTAGEISKISAGKITIKNDTDQRQSLRKETRFQTEDGLVFKTYSAVTLKPKSEATVKAFSDGVGEKYNIKKDANLTVPGFKEAKMDDEFEKITGKVAEDFVFTKDDTTKQVTQQKVEKTEGSIKYSVLTTELERSKEIASIGVDSAEKKAEGEIEISNNLSKAQKLRKETRFQSKNGSVYKTFKSVTIPAKGKVKAKVFADVAGEKHNASKGTNLVVPGFKEAKMDKEFENIKAVVSSDIKGGSIGKTNIPNKDELEKAKTELKNTILDELTIETKKQKKDGDIILGNNFHTSYNFATESVGDKVVVKVKAIQKAPVVSKKDFIKMIFKSDNKKIENLDNIEIQNYSKLVFRILNPQSFNIGSGQSFNFAVKGDAVVGWVLNQGEFKNKIVGKSEKKIKEIMKNEYKNFNINVLISPFWRSSVPSDVDDIDVVIKE